MKLKVDKKIFRRRCKPFLVLPTIEKDSIDKSQEDLFTMTNKNTGLKLFTKTWTPKREKKNKKTEEQPRPLTATLEKPMILDISLVGKIDMSKIRKEFLNISNLCRVPLIIKNKNVLKVNRPLSLPPPEKHKNKKKKISDAEDSFEDEESTSVQSARKIKNDKINNKIKTASKKGGLLRPATISDANNNKTLKVPRKCGVANGKVMNLKSELIKSTKLPEPCSTCGRPDQPERFHSHPATLMRSTGKRTEESPKIPVKSTVQKPVAIKYKSKTNAEKKAISPPRKPLTSTPPVQKASHIPQTVQRTSNPTVTSKPAEPVPRAKSAKRTLTCYLCGREFGTASLPLHEPKCLEKWERENASLPPHLRRKPPPKPDHSMSKDEWNKLAWEASQATLVPCQNCGRTFYPDRLLVHQKSCKTPQNNPKTTSSELQVPNNPIPMSQSSPATPSGRRPPSVECYICGKMFGSNSIKIHEKQCLKKWNIENESLPPDMRSPPPTRNTEKKSVTPEPEQQRSLIENEKEKEDRPKSAKKPPLFPCYICGKLFTVNSIYIHEPQCLKMWKIENDKLPPNKRRPQPLKPDIKFTRDGKVDYEATNEAHWQSHLSQLVPCKNCARTFNPDRVEVHERSCKGF
ncbi:uncharacterized protein LOC108913016 isoform X2 [Anoplophora glabripennis]|uniref:uncharacterized protein LOC108913016 isoform X2 n=1 Tax=Anoplophora glabripennis TaxID=217634 RepID=UPI00087512B8|nr:uncharacterized protein LOC108913016 isoform X2 [Anoplophora glabripennis]